MFIFFFTSMKWIEIAQVFLFMGKFELKTKIFDLFEKFEIIKIWYAIISGNVKILSYQLEVDVYTTPFIFCLIVSAAMVTQNKFLFLPWTVFQFSIKSKKFLFFFLFWTSREFYTKQIRWSSRWLLVSGNKKKIKLFQ